MESQAPHYYLVFSVSSIKETIFPMMHLDGAKDQLI